MSPSLGTVPADGSFGPAWLAGAAWAVAAATAGVAATVASTAAAADPVISFLIVCMRSPAT